MKQVKVLFVCLGNICRSPSAEAIMNTLVAKAGLSDLIHCDSAGTSGYHDGEDYDPRSTRHALKRGYKMTNLSRKFKATSDFQNFEYIVVMDDQNHMDVLEVDRERKYRHKVHKMVAFHPAPKHDKVPDPYYEGPEAFEEVLDILEEACAGLLKKIRAEHQF